MMRDMMSIVFDKRYRWEERMMCFCVLALAVMACMSVAIFIGVLIEKWL